jgi:hypothetical protein
VVEQRALGRDTLEGVDEVGIAQLLDPRMGLERKVVRHNMYTGPERQLRGARAANS